MKMRTPLLLLLVISYFTCLEEDIKLEGIWELHQMENTLKHIKSAELYKISNDAYIESLPIVFHKNRVEFPTYEKNRSIWSDNFRDYEINGNILKIHFSNKRSSEFIIKPYRSDQFILYQNKHPLFYLSKLRESNNDGLSIKRVIIKIDYNDSYSRILLNTKGEYFIEFLGKHRHTHKWIEGVLESEYNKYIWTIFNRVDYKENNENCIFEDRPYDPHYSINIFHKKETETNLQIMDEHPALIGSQVCALLINLTRLEYQLFRKHQKEFYAPEPEITYFD